ncbi:hypothetical protein P5G65_23235 [Paenibacillus chondroitinus]|uniref:Lipoprotein n=1 Tax=Paenibacillus chondroitinus TaxID=59842 RepID=A0ABU6DIZ1_9BACL|nr:MULTISPECIES: hypothetical protein [Paenibacillus]MCY9659426.1 hypothetical protein [Paenibacillus anseongense]MEB4796821.1 hypothetical protein [Paenibacillus chondroitinus]
MHKKIAKSALLFICSIALIVALSGCQQKADNTQKKEDMSNMDHSKMNMGDSKEKK